MTLPGQAGSVARTGGAARLRRYSMRWFARSWVWLGLVLALSVDPSGMRRAHAADDSTGASDAPSLQSGNVELPALPAGYKTFEGGWIEFGYPPELRKRIQPLIDNADRAKAMMTARFGVQVLSSVHVRIARTLDEMSTLAPADAPYPEYAAGVAYSEIGLVLLSAESARPDGATLEEVFEHELAHVALHDAVSGRAVPRWFNEGLAIHLSGEATLARMSTLSSAAISNSLLPLRSLIHNFPSDLVGTPLAYAQSADLVRFLLRQQTAERFKSLMSRVRKDQSFEAALTDAYGFDFGYFAFDAAGL